jgi:hypothetical protein
MNDKIIQEVQSKTTTDISGNADSTSTSGSKLDSRVFEEFRLGGKPYLRNRMTGQISWAGNLYQEINLETGEERVVVALPPPEEFEPRSKEDRKRKALGLPYKTKGK